MKDSYKARKYVIISIIMLMGFIFVVRLFFLQIVDNEYKLSAENNVLRYVVQYPARGLIYDRSDNLLVYNEAAYDLLIVPKQLKDFDTTELCQLLDIEKHELIENILKARKYSYYKPSIFLEQITSENYGRLQEKLYKFNGFYVQKRTLRKYPYKNAAHILGYVGEVNQNEIKKDKYYKQGDYIGKSGIEKSYEKELRGKKGLKIRLVDVFNRIKGSYKDGRFDTLAEAGKNLQISLDIELQQYGEMLMKNKKGSIVAIEPASGEILALVSTPSYDPNLLIGRVRSENYKKLSKDSLQPLFNRATMAQYPPGSTFKLINALIGLEENVLTRNTKYSCNGLNTKPIGCSHDHFSPLKLISAIELSCNPYFWNVFKSIIENPKYSNTKEAYDNWRKYVKSFNIGEKFNTDISNQTKGFIPLDTYYNKYYGKNHWKALTIRSLAIGQGEILLSPLQLANTAAIIANSGFYYPPHFFKTIDDENELKPEFVKKVNTIFKKKHFKTIIEGMFQVYEGEHGTARWFKNDSIQICGKTGTSQNPHGENHSIFIAFAPKDNPRIAISVVVENSGSGAKWAAPIATLMIEKYLFGEVKPNWFEENIINTNLLGN
ncbi:MAG: penicillin-binding protein 2 [Bacteroidales bacterium]|nr:penicillin-binding protein 2 [Bacteroidales bacterium]